MSDQRHERVKLVIIHDYQEDPGVCMPGEEVVAMILIYRGKRYRIPLSPTHLVLMDYLARCRYPEDAWRISAQMQLDPFTTDHGINAPGHCVRSARTSRAAVRMQVSRIRGMLTALIVEEELDMDAEEIIRSEVTSTRTVRYKIDADVSWEHLPRQKGRGRHSNPYIYVALPSELGSAPVGPT